MNRSCLRPLLLLLLLLAAPAFAQSSPRLDGVLKQMDAASKTFKTARADFDWSYYEKIVNDTSVQKGSIYFERQGAATNMGAVIVDPAAKTKGNVVKVIEYKGGIVQLFDPGTDQITVLHEGGNQAEIESFLTLGFGGSGTDLQRAWTITDLGPDKLADDGQSVAVEKLDLVGRTADSRKNFSHITIWVDPVRAISLKQIAYSATGGNYRTATYTHIKLNGSIDKGRFEIKKDKNTTTINH